MTAIKNPQNLTYIRDDILPEPVILKKERLMPRERQCYHSLHIFLPSRLTTAHAATRASIGIARSMHALDIRLNDFDLLPHHDIFSKTRFFEFVGISTKP